MAKVIITLEDTGDEINLKISGDSPGTVEYEDMTNAQHAAMWLLQQLALLMKGGQPDETNDETTGE